MTRKTFGALRADARREGEKAGKRAGASFFDGNTDDATYARVLAGIDDGDPEILDALPMLDLSGQWADGDTDRDVLDLIGVVYEEDGDDVEGDEVKTNDDGDEVVGVEGQNDLIADFRDAYDSAVVAEIKRIARSMLAK